MSDFAAEQYKKARKAGIKAFREAGGKGRYPYLTALDEILLHTKTAGKEELGVFEIPLARVTGTRTASRSESFAWNFMPLLQEKTEFSGKWERLYEAQMEEGIREPVKVYEYMHHFYVREGNKRVSVMKFVGAVKITADITRILPKRDGKRASEAFYQYAAFNRVTGLFDLLFSEPEAYQKLASRFGESLAEKWEEDKIQELRAAFGRFCSCYERKAGPDSLTEESDAFFVYLEVYGCQGLLTDSDRQIRERMERAWEEMKLARQKKKVALIEEHGEAEGEKNGLFAFRHGGEKQPLRIAFINGKDSRTSAWAYGHRLGWQALKNQYGNQVKISVYNHCDTEGATRDALAKAVLQKNDIIFTTAGQMRAQALETAVNHPEIKFLNCSVNASYRSIRSYYARMYEAKFILGMTAASLCEDGRIAYIADYPVYGAVASINAFAIGAQMIRPDVKIYLKWSNLKNSDWKTEIEKAGFTMVSGPDLKLPSEESRLFGLFRYNQKKGDYENLAMPLIDWGRYYCLLIESVMDGNFNSREFTKTGQAVNYFFGMSAKVVSVFFSSRVPYPVRKLANVFEEEIIQGRFSPFDGEIRTKRGRLKGDDSGSLDMFQIVKMDWLNDNVIGKIPGIGAFKEDARELLSALGVEAARTEGEYNENFDCS
ncbi:MAG: BMP family ABC transporter substrate-binding protein [Clostridium sp.]|nr:BMP family ABC transporter substrate-binding protein [Clostridium sp.]